MSVKRVVTLDQAQLDALIWIAEYGIDERRDDLENDPYEPEEMVAARQQLEDASSALAALRLAALGPLEVGLSSDAEQLVEAEIRFLQDVIATYPDSPRVEDRIETYTELLRVAQAAEVLFDEPAPATADDWSVEYEPTADGNWVVLQINDPRRAQGVDEPQLHATLLLTETEADQLREALKMPQCPARCEHDMPCDKVAGHEAFVQYHHNTYCEWL